MSNNKQSSIDWLIDTMHRSAGLDQHQIDLIIEQAKAMHEEEINDAHTTGYIIGGGNGDIYEPKQYYNETFGGNK